MNSNPIQNFLQKNNKNLFQCIDDLSLNHLYKYENITFLHPTDRKIVNNIVYNYINNQEMAIVQIKSLFIKGYYPKLEHFNKVNIINFNNEKLNFNKDKSSDELVVLGGEYEITLNPNYVKKSGFMLYNLKTDKLPLNGNYVEAEKEPAKQQISSNVNLNNIKNKLHLYVKNNYYNFLKKDINIFRVLSNLILNGLAKNTIHENKIINDESQKILDKTNTKITPISRSTFYLLIDKDDPFNVFKHINNEIFELIENIINGKVSNRIMVKCDSAKTYNNLLKHIRSNTTNSYNKPIQEKIKKLNTLANNPTNIDFINYLKKVYKETYSADYSAVLNNHIFTILCEIYICMEQAEASQVSVKSAYSEFKNNFLIFIETSKLNNLFKYSNDVVRMYSIFNTLTRCNFFLQDMNTFCEDSDGKSHYTVYNRQPSNNETIYIHERDDDSGSNENYEKLLEI